MMSRYKPVLETTYAYMPKNRAQVSQELGGWRTERSSEGHASHAIRESLQHCWRQWPELDPCEGLCAFSVFFSFSLFFFSSKSKENFQFWGTRQWLKGKGFSRVPLLASRLVAKPLRLLSGNDPSLSFVPTCRRAAFALRPNPLGCEERKERETLPPKSY